MLRAFLLASLLAVAADAQPVPSPEALLQSMETAVAEFDYEAAEARAREAIVRYLELTPDQLVTVHTTLGVLLHRRNEPVQAGRQFELALSLDPGVTLDPVLVPPATIEFFQEVRESISPGPGSGGTTRYLVLEDRRPGAVLRSLVAPGWGQFHKGDGIRGVAFAGAATIATAGLIASALAVGETGREYRAATNQGEAEELYIPYNRMYRTRNAFAIGTAVVWSAALLDALLTGAPDAPRQLSLGPSPDVAGLRLQARF